jgi:sulfatase maturation enzyme AslB (radical SAM superfamily)
MTKNWCPLLYKSILTENDGTYKTCCHGQEIAVTEHGSPMTRLTHSVSEVFNGSWLTSIRKDIEQGNRPNNCNYCWQLEDAGIESFRQTNINILGVEDQTQQLEILDLSLGNQCNLKCRTCTPEDSSVWVQESYDLDNVEGSLKDYQRQMIILEPDDSKFFEDLKNNLETVNIIKMFGGEPFMMKRTWQLLQHAIDIGCSKNITLYFNTNGTFWDEDNVKLFEHFKRVDIGLSIDGVGERFEYMRHPAKWDIVENNIKRITQWRDQKKQDRNVLLTHTVSAYNAWYVDEAVTLADTYNLQLYINLCLQDWDTFAIQHLPTKVKQLINNKLSALTDTRHCSEIKKLLDYQCTGSNSQAWWDEVVKRDKYRKENYSETFSEFYQILKELGEINDTSI